MNNFSIFRPPAFLRQMSECSEYTTDTHDTGETAQARHHLICVMNSESKVCFANLFYCVKRYLLKYTIIGDS